MQPPNMCHAIMSGYNSGMYILLPQLQVGKLPYFCIAQNELFAQDVEMPNWAAQLPSKYVAEIFLKL